MVQNWQMYGEEEEAGDDDEEVGWLFCLMVYQPLSGHLTPN